MPDALAPDASGRPTAPRSEPEPHRLRTSLLGRRLDARLASPAVIAWLERYWCYDEHAVEAHPYTIRITEEPEFDEVSRSTNESWSAEGHGSDADPGSDEDLR